MADATTIDTTTIVAITTAVTVPVTTIITILLTKGIDAWIRVRKTNLEEKQYMDGVAKTDRDLLIGELTTRVQNLAADLKSVQQDHINCVEKQARLEGRDEQRAKELEMLREEVKSLREWRHAVAGQAQAMVANAAADKLGLPPVTPVSGPRDDAA